jgi:hypothetical protein
MAWFGLYKEDLSSPYLLLRVQVALSHIQNCSSWWWFEASLKGNPKMHSSMEPFQKGSGSKGGSEREVVLKLGHLGDQAKD